VGALPDPDTGAELDRIRPHKGAILDTVLSPDGKHLAIADGAHIRSGSLTDANGNATIGVTELAGSIDQMVPAFSNAAFGMRQVPQMSVKDSDFSMGSRISVPGGPAAESFPATLTHVVAGGTAVADVPSGPQVMTRAGIFFGVCRIEECRRPGARGKERQGVGMGAGHALAPLQRKTAGGFPPTVFWLQSCDVP